MKRNLFCSIMAIAVLATAACEKESPVTSQEEPDAKKAVTVSVIIPQEGIPTKVSFEEQDTDPGEGVKMRLTKLSWDDTDQLSINGTVFDIDPSSISVDKKSAQFTGTEPEAVGGK